MKSMNKFKQDNADFLKEAMGEDRNLIKVGMSTDTACT